MINLKTNKEIIKENIFDGDDIWWIKTDKINKCVIVATRELNKLLLLDYHLNIITDHP